MLYSRMPALPRSWDLRRRRWPQARRLVMLLRSSAQLSQARASASLPSEQAHAVRSARRELTSRQERHRPLGAAWHS